MADCATMLQALLHNAEVTARMLQEHDVIAACVQAAETEHAARIATVATRQAANWGLFAGFIAGFSVLVAAGIAYQAARMQVRLTEAQNRARRVAYQTHFQELVFKAIRNIDYIVTDWNKYKSLVNDNKITKISDGSALFNLQCELQSLNWQNHALLNECAIQLITSVPGYISVSLSLIEICVQKNEVLDTILKAGVQNGLTTLKAKLVELSDSVAQPSAKSQGATA